MSAVDALLARLPRATLVLGKGGVGKTTTAAALALEASEREAAMVLSTDPARALPSVLDCAVGSDAAPVPYAPRLHARLLDAGALRSAFLERWSDVLRVILDRGTYLDAADIAPLVDSAFPGGDEIFAALELARLFAEESDPTPGDRQSARTKRQPDAGHATAAAARRLFVDTAPTGHTLRLLQLPATFQALVRLLDTMQEKHRFMVRTLARSYRPDEADRFLVEMGALVSALESTLRDPARCAAILVANDQPLVVDETTRYLSSLREMGITVTAVIWNGVDAPDRDAFDALVQYVVPRLATWPVGEEGLRAWSGAMREAGSRGVRPQRSGLRTSRPAAARGSDVAALIATLTLVGGKGGVGKTTVATALAIRSAASRRTLLVSTDPAPSVGDALGQAIPDADTPVTGVSGLAARQMDATAAFARLRDEYASRVDALFDGLMGRGMDLSADRAIVRDLLRLAPPGVDEVYALTLIADALFDDSYERVIVDPAPTGHLLRLLEMPQLALAWAHQLMRLLLKYKDVAGLGESAQDLLDLSRRLRALDALLRDPTRSSLVLVTLAEPVVEEETTRLAAEVRQRGVHISGVVRNRSTDAARGRSLPVPDVPVHFEAPSTDPPPAGFDEIRRWTDRWTPAHAS